jgi:regulatory protein
VRVESVRREASGIAIVAAGGSSFAVDLALLEELGLPSARLKPGAELDEAETATLSLVSEEREAEHRALALLARAEQSSFMLRVKLEQRGFSSRAASIAIERLSYKSLVDDKRFARAWALSRLRHSGSRAEGPASLIAALRERGIDRTVAAEAIAEILGAEVEPEARAEALSLAFAKELKRSKDDKDEARRRLRALGYKSEEISDCFDRQNH